MEQRRRWPLDICELSSKAYLEQRQWKDIKYKYLKKPEDEEGDDE